MMSTITARRPNSGSDVVDRKLVASCDDAQLQKLLKEGWIIKHEGVMEVKLEKIDTRGNRKKLTHKRRRA